MTTPLPNLSLVYAQATTEQLLYELHLLDYWLPRYPHMHRFRAWQELKNRNTAVFALYLKHVRRV